MASSSENIDVTYVADLARLRLSPEEIATFQKQLSDVLGYVSQLNEVDVSQISLLGETDLKNRLRTDVTRASLAVPLGPRQRAAPGQQPLRRPPHGRMNSFFHPSYPNSVWACSLAPCETPFRADSRLPISAAS